MPTVCKNFNFWSIAILKNVFMQFSPNLSILEHMLLHNTNINVAIAHILVCRNSLYDLQGQSYKNQWGAKPSKVGVVKNGCYPEIQKWYEVQICSSWSKIPYPVVRLLLTKNANGITLHTGLVIKINILYFWQKIW